MTISQRESSPETSLHPIDTPTEPCAARSFFCVGRMDLRMECLPTQYTVRLPYAYLMYTAR
jgi:hypothetical protein